MAGHLPVMLPQVLGALNIHDGGQYIDATFGGGGYTRGVLATAGTTVLGIDKDHEAIARGKAMQQEFGKRLSLFEGSYADLEKAVREEAISSVDGIMFDLGVSSYQLDTAERGFSFSKDGPLDMRMGGLGLTAADLVNQWSEDQLADIFWRYGDERNNKKIARSITERRKVSPFTRTLDLAEHIAKLCPAYGKPIHPATRVFQALRIAVNNELDDLEQAMAASLRVLARGGRLVVVSFHSLEDRIVKQAMQAVVAPRQHVNKYKLSKAGRDDKYGEEPAFALINNKPWVASLEEVRSNPRSRSAKLRVLERVQ